MENREFPIFVSHRIKGFTPLSGLLKVYPIGHHTHRQATYPQVSIIPTSEACWEYHSSSSQQVGSVLWGVQPRVIMMQVFYDINI